MAPLCWKIVLNFEAESEMSSRLLESETCPCRYCWCCEKENCESSWYSESYLCRIGVCTTSEVTLPKWRLVLISGDDSSEFSSRLHDSEKCICDRYCWCDNNGMRRLQNAACFKSVDSLKDLLPCGSLKIEERQSLESAGKSKNSNAELKTDGGDEFEGFRGSPDEHSETTEIEREIENVVQNEASKEFDQKLGEEIKPEADLSIKIESPDNSEEQPPSELSKVTFKCCICPLRFNSRQERADHHRSVHQNASGGYKCKHCDYTSCNINSVTGHLLTHTGEKPYKCDLCSRSFTQLQNMERHKKQIHTGEKPFKCDQCPSSFIRPGVLKSHKNAFHTVHETEEDVQMEDVSENCPPALNDCIIPSTSDDVQSALEVQSQNDQPPLDNPQAETFNCSLCDSSFKTKKQRSIHLIKKHKDDDGRFICNTGNKCQFSCDLISEMLKHGESHRQKRTYGCALCREQFFEQDELEKHKAKEHSIKKRRRKRKHQ